jgi:hypothetical protein
VHSLTSKSNTHGPAENFLSTGFVLDGFPSLGSWSTYALGSESQELPSYVAIPDPRGVPQNGSNNWGPGFLPAAFQGTTMSSKAPVRHLTAPGVSASADGASRSLLQRMNARMNARHLELHPRPPSHRKGRALRPTVQRRLRQRRQLNWDGHSDLKEQYDIHAAILDQPAAASFATSNSAVCCRIPRSSGAPNLGACPFSKKAPKAATTIPTASPAG